MKTIFIGTFPPPIGGVTLKNKMIVTELAERIDFVIIDFGKHKKSALLKILLQLLLPQRRYVLSIGSNKNLLRTMY